MRSGHLGHFLDRPAFLANVQPLERSWWRPLVVLALGGGLAVIAMGVVMLTVLGVAALVVSATSQGAISIAEASRLLTYVSRTDRSLQSYTYELTTVGLGSYAAAWTFMAVAARVYRRPLLTFLTAAARFRWRLVLLGLAAALPIMGGAVMLSYLSGQGPDTAPLFAPEAAFWARLVYVAAACGFLYLAALAEEMLFRGWLLQQTAAFIRNAAVLLAINGLVFSAAHFDPNLGAFLIRAAMGAAWTWIVLRTGGIEFALGAHLANNLLVSLFIRPVTFAPMVRQPIDYGELAIEVLGLAVMVAVAELVVRKRALGAIAPAPEPAA